MWLLHRCQLGVQGSCTRDETRPGQLGVHVALGHEGHSSCSWKDGKICRTAVLVPKEVRTGGSDNDFGPGRLYFKTV